MQITTSLIEHANSDVPSVLASLTKGGPSAATKSLAIEYAKRGIRVYAIAPGVIKTPMHALETIRRSPTSTRSDEWARFRTSWARSSTRIGRLRDRRDHSRRGGQSAGH